jgi:hypothetical protein
MNIGGKALQAKLFGTFAGELQDLLLLASFAFHDYFI